MNDNKRKGLEKNIRYFYVYAFFQMFALFTNFFLVYLKEGLGFTITQAATASAMYSLTFGLFQIPAGVIGDKTGYRRVMIAGTSLSMLGALLFSIFSSFHHILFAEFVWGLGMSLSVGVETSFIYETMKGLGRESEFKKVVGKATAFFWLGVAASGITGSMMTEVSIWLPVSFGFLPLTVPVLAALKFREPERKLAENDFISHARESAGYVLSHGKLKFLVFYVIVLSIILGSTRTFIQLFLNNIGVTLGLFGFIYFFGYLFSAVGALVSHRIESLLGERRTLYFLYAAAALMLAAAGYVNSLFAIPFVLILLILDGIRSPISYDYLNRNIKSRNRATVNSMVGIGTNVAIAGIMPLLGFLGDSAGINFVFLVGAAGLVVGLAVPGVWYNKL
jgi:MFS family permease